MSTQGGSSSSSSSSSGCSCSKASAAPQQLDAETLNFLCNCSRLSADDIQQLYAQFKAAQPAGSVSEFMSFVSKTHSSHAELRRKANQFFQVFDINKDRSVSRDEVLTILRSVFETASDRGVQVTRTPEEICDVFFCKMDTDRDRLISREEFVDGVLCDPDLLRVLHNPEVMNTLSK